MRYEPVRVATVRATGKRYLVSGLHLPRDPRQERKVFCRGEVVAVKGRTTTHGPGLILPLEDVTIAEVEKTPALVRELWEQSLNARRAAGHLVVERRRGATDYGTEAERVAREAARARAGTLMGAVKARAAAYVAAGEDPAAARLRAACDAMDELLKR